MYKKFSRFNMIGFLFVLIWWFFAFYVCERVVAIPFFNEETELSMGRAADKQVVAQYGLYSDKSLQLYVNQIGQNLVSNLSDQVFPKFFFKVVDSSVINAFALPNSRI